MYNNSTYNTEFKKCSAENFGTSIKTVIKMCIQIFVIETIFSCLFKNITYYVLKMVAVLCNKTIEIT